METGTSLDPGLSVALTPVPCSICSQEKMSFNHRGGREGQVGSLHMRPAWWSTYEFKSARTIHIQQDPDSRQAGWSVGRLWGLGKEHAAQEYIIISVKRNGLGRCDQTHHSLDMNLGQEPLASQTVKGTTLLGRKPRGGAGGSPTVMFTYSFIYSAAQGGIRPSESGVP